MPNVKKHYVLIRCIFLWMHNVGPLGRMSTYTVSQVLQRFFIPCYVGAAVKPLTLRQASGI